MTTARGGHTTRRKTGVAALVVAVALAGAVAAACSSDSDSASYDEGSSVSDDAAGGDVAEESDGVAAPAPGDEASADRSDADGSGAGGAGSDGGVGLAYDTVAFAEEREVIRTGEVDLRVDDVRDGVEGVRDAADAAGGFVSHESATVDSGHAGVTVRVPTDRFDDVRDAVAELGEVTEQSVRAEDVTAEMVDIESRATSLRRSVERLQEMLGGTGDVAQLATVEGELARREAELEAMLGQQRVMEDQVALATLTVSLYEDEPAPEPDDDAAGFGDGLHQGWVSFIDVGRGFLAAVGFSLPWLALGLVVGLPAWVVVRRRSRPGAPATPAPTAADG